MVLESIFLDVMVISRRWLLTFNSSRRNRISFCNELIWSFKLSINNWLQSFALATSENWYLIFDKIFSFKCFIAASTNFWSTKFSSLEIIELLILDCLNWFFELLYLFHVSSVWDNLLGVLLITEVLCDFRVVSLNCWSVSLTNSHSFICRVLLAEITSIGVLLFFLIK